MTRCPNCGSDPIERERGLERMARLINASDTLAAALREALRRALDLAEEGFSRGWDGLDRAERTYKLDELRRILWPA